ncbi:uncharacterized protein LOC142907335 [Petromyzon marinus]|uniref:uncharacterized protein LOC142907335 n=1 Tax=Petromyzon marinus TaxID=7757 RepID=UPI003F6FC0DA
MVSRRRDIGFEPLAAQALVGQILPGTAESAQVCRLPRIEDCPPLIVTGARTGPPDFLKTAEIKALLVQLPTDELQPLLRRWGLVGAQARYKRRLARSSSSGGSAQSQSRGGASISPLAPVRVPTRAATSSISTTTTTTFSISTTTSSIATTSSTTSSISTTSSTTSISTTISTTSSTTTTASLSPWPPRGVALRAAFSTSRCCCCFSWLWLGPPWGFHGSSGRALRESHGRQRLPSWEDPTPKPVGSGPHHGQKELRRYRVGGRRGGGRRRSLEGPGGAGRLRWRLLTGGVELLTRRRSPAEFPTPGSGGPGQRR